MPLINTISARLQNHPKRIVFPEGGDPRILQAARRIVSNRLGTPILLGDRSEIKDRAMALNINLDGIRIIEPARSSDFPAFVERLRAMERFRKLSREEAEEKVSEAAYFACLMVLNGNASGIVSGATLSASSALRPILQLLPFQPGIQTISSLQILDFEELNSGSDNVLFLADCAVIPEPNAQQLADIAINTGLLAYHLTNRTPKIAMLSYTSKATSNKDPSVRKMQEATQLTLEKVASHSVKMDVDGELQVDAALEQHTAEAKGIHGPVAGRANVLVFPDLQSANIGSKLAQVLTGVRTYGSILTGLAFPAAEISRGASAHDIFGTAVMVGAQAIDHKLLHLSGHFEGSPPP
jgi:phosphate acetyltransferase